MLDSGIAIPSPERGAKKRGSSRNRVGDFEAENRRKLCISYVVCITAKLRINHQFRMARPAKRRRRLWDGYSFPGFRPQPTVRGIFGDPKARVITLNRRSNKRLAAVAVTCRWAGTTERSAACAICPAATLGYIWNWRCGGSTAAAVAR